MARTQAHHRTAEQQAAWEAQEAADARETFLENKLEMCLFSPFVLMSVLC
jgi:hypothetical protein